MKLSPKAIRFIVEALDDFVRSHDQHARSLETTEDEVADWENDRQFIEAIKQDCLDELTQHVEPVHVEV